LKQQWSTVLPLRFGRCRSLDLAPDRHPQLGAQLAALHQRARSFARAVIRREATDASAAAAHNAG
jgi:hypothetical protein